jgi:hypothetical protein
VYRLEEGEFQCAKIHKPFKITTQGPRLYNFLLQKNGNMKFVGEAWSVSSYAFQVIACCFEGKQLVTL